MSRKRTYMVEYHNSFNFSAGKLLSVAGKIIMGTAWLVVLGFILIVLFCSF